MEVAPVVPNASCTHNPCFAADRSDKLKGDFYDILFSILQDRLGFRYRFRMFLFDPRHGRSDKVDEIDKGTVVLLYGDEYSTVFPKEIARRAAHVIKQYCPASWESRGIIPVTDRTMNFLSDDSGRTVPACSCRTLSVLFSGNFNHRRVDLYRGLCGQSFGWPFRCPACYPETGKNPLFPLIQARLIEKVIRRFRFIQDFSDRFSNSSIRFYNGFFKGGRESIDYLSRLQNTKIVWCPPGFVTSETSRLLEASQAGCAIIVGKLPDSAIYYGHPFVVIDDWRDIVQVTNDLLRNNEHLNELGKASRAWYLSHFSPEAQARRIVATIQKQDDSSHCNDLFTQ